MLLLGAILTPGQRTVTAALRIVGLSAEKHFQTYHRVLNRAAWSSWAVSRTLLGVLVQTFVPTGPVIGALDPTLERRRGAQIKAKGIYRDPVRSSKSHFVKASGLRWLSLMLLAPIPWAGRVWALPFLTCLAPSERYYEGKARAHKKMTDWGRQMIMPVRRWLPDRQLVFVADSEFAVSAWLFRLTQLPGRLCLIVRLRLDAALYEPAPKRTAHTPGRPRKKGQRLPTLEQVAADPKTRWRRQTIRNGYGQGRRVIEFVSQTAVWFHSGHRFDNPSTSLRTGFSVTVLGGGHYTKTQGLARIRGRSLSQLIAPPANTTWRVYYYANGQPIAMRELPPGNAAGTLYFLHSDHPSASLRASPGLHQRRHQHQRFSGRAAVVLSVRRGAREHGHVTHEAHLHRPARGRDRPVLLQCALLRAADGAVRERGPPAPRAGGLSPHRGDGGCRSRATRRR